MQKKDDKFHLVNQLALGDPVLCLVKQWAALVTRICSYQGVLDNTTVDTFLYLGRLLRLTLADMVQALCDAAAAVGEERLDFAKEDIGTHSIRSRAAMSFYLGKCPVNMIMMIRQWLSEAFLLYIQKQVKQFSHNISCWMLMFDSHNHIPNFNPSVSQWDPHQWNHANNAATCQHAGDSAPKQARLPAFSLFH
ncbi:hypothetical protein ACHAXS_002260 [Conticribra weissflogii]